jgi:orotidine-5'-phosphate decarboxylase
MPKRIFVALDTANVEEAVGLARRLKGLVGGVKLGLEYFNANGPSGVREVTETGLPLFLDLKIHDIPNTVAGAVRAAVPLEPMVLNVHASGGAAMMEAARDAAAEAARQHGVRPPLVIAVTVLTSLDDKDLAAVGQSSPASAQAARLAQLARDCRLDGVVCAAPDIPLIRETCGADFKLVVPGIRPTQSSAADQKRTATPAAALREGADYLVIGRPITAASDPAEAARRIGEELAGA